MTTDLGLFTLLKLRKGINKHVNIIYAYYGSYCYPCFKDMDNYGNGFYENEKYHSNGDSYVHIVNLSYFDDCQ